MPLVSSTYKPKTPFTNGHFNTIYAAKIRRIKGVTYNRERITLSDGDFLDVDFSFSQSEKKSSQMTILVHGLEGHAKRPYMQGTARILNQNDFDCASINLRGCSGEDNTKIRSYHSGASEDLADVVNYIVSKNKYKAIYLCGFSLGGNIILKYLGETRDRPDLIQAAVAVSTPVDLYGSLGALQKRTNWVYRWSFLKDLKKKYNAKLKVFPNELSKENKSKIKSLLLFDELYTAPANGFENALDYYKKSSSKQFLGNINIPTLIINAFDDSFLNEKCYPKKEAEQNKNLYLEIPAFGGHVGFMTSNEVSYNEKRTLYFFNSQKKEKSLR
ncbi:YheT family hydrolase [Leeuwenhoekiella polynyae]|uniref:AB hydrolase-1 domain-containing protein n=1 Tax=Leeuwenhoekiella polynyae TaxID=1550906 RepID=A0A4Q0P8F0_9FLAO|nr:alpha/beta fold hydrolase [Leeuwenhoekiella polynyae]RXG22994.1 hypothetical protein DSM02_1712 [Leeuwenhoekiella polynyae]